MKTFSVLLCRVLNPRTRYIINRKVAYHHSPAVHITNRKVASHLYTKSFATSSANSAGFSTETPFISDAME